MRRASRILAVATAIAGAFAVGLALHPGRRDHGTTSVVQQVRSELATRYYRRVPAEVLRLRSVSEMIAALDDPYTRLLDPASFRLFRRETTGSYSGVGLTLLPGSAGLLVTRTQPGPARIAGVRPGDTVLAVDGASTARLSYEQALGRILGREGSPVRLTVLRGDRTLHVRLVRVRFATPGVQTRVLTVAGTRIGYVSIAAFTLGTVQTVDQALAEVKRAGARSLVLDLRGNPGGLLDQAVAVSSLFLDRGVVVSTRGAHLPPRSYQASGRVKCHLPLVVLVDRGSASAAEVVAAALRDHGRAKLVGESTFGKALVQSIEPLGGGAALKLTVARYLTPAGTDISRGGVRPDIRSRHPLATALRVLAARR